MIPNNITRERIINAIQEIDEGVRDHFLVNLTNMT